MRLIDFLNFHSAPTGGEPGHSTMPEHGHPEQQWGRKYKGGKDKGGVQGEAAGTQSTGSSKVAVKYRVIDYVGRIIHDHLITREEAEDRASGNPYARVESYIPDEDTQALRDTARNTTAKKIRKKRKGPFDRRTAPYPDTFSRSPKGLLE